MSLKNQQFWAKTTSFYIFVLALFLTIFSKILKQTIAGRNPPLSQDGSGK